MAQSILYGLAQKVLENLGSAALTKIASAWGFNTQLEKLENTINTLKDVLMDAEDRQADTHATDSHAVRGWLERLSTVVYAADDLFDEFNTVAARKQLTGGSKLTKEVCTFFSHSNQVAFAFKISRNIKNIRKQLDDIERDARKFNFVPCSPARGSAISRMRDQTMSYVDEHKVVGRDDDKKKILDMLLASSSTDHELKHEELPVISIVGMGGMGKTTLTQLIYNDPQVKEYFNMRLWVCVSEVFDIKVIIEKLLKSATCKDHSNLEMEQLQGLLRKEVADKRYLLVLDDVWNEKRKEWLALRDLLIGRKGSKILVTTRSLEVANIMDTCARHDLQGLSEEKSWELFEKMAFKRGEAKQKPHLVKIGKEIVEKCRFVPLAIITLGSLLYGQEERKWLSVKNAHDNQIESDIMNILKYSYNHLCSPLKNCFAYCALFPEDYRFDKEILIDLWIAQGFVVPDVKNGQSLDEAAEEYFRILLRRGFFQDVNMNEWEEIESCKMHDFMHELAKEVAGVKCKFAKADERNFDEKVVHLSLAYEFRPSWILNSMVNMKLLRTFLPLPIHRSTQISQEILTRFGCLRVLDLQETGLKSLPSSIGKLIHLRYLNLSHTRIEKLSDSITDLWNLQTLKLSWCNELRELPRKMRKLINLRRLDVDVCHLSHMPSGLGGLTLLNNLPLFIVGGEHDAAKLSDLKNLNKLRGTLAIDIKRNMENSMVEARKAELSNKHHLTELFIFFPDDNGDDISDGEAADSDGEVGDCKHDEAVLEGLEPPSTLKRLWIVQYRGEKVPSWARMDKLCTTLHSLVDVTLRICNRFQQLTAFSQLPFLKRLCLEDMERVEYIESNDVGGVPSSSTSSRRFFPSLEKLTLWAMRDLKGWWNEVEASEYENDKSGSERASKELAAQQIPKRFPELTKLCISHCPKLRLLPLCPNLEDLKLWGTNEILSVLKIATTSTSSSSSSAPSSSSGLNLKLLEIHEDDKLESTERLGDVFANVSSSLRSLKLDKCKKLRSIAKGLEHLMNLETLELSECKELDVFGDEEGMPWKTLNTTLRSLELKKLPKMVGLPRGLQHLSNLRSLTLTSNPELEELPEWMSCFSSLEYLLLAECPKLTCLPEAFCQLTSLNRLRIFKCPGLAERCQCPNGSDWPKIQHIPHRSVYFD